MSCRLSHRALLHPLANVAVGSTSYVATGTEGAAQGTVDGSLVDCGLSDGDGLSCSGNGDFICLIQRGDISFAD